MSVLAVRYLDHATAIKIERHVIYLPDGRTRYIIEEPLRTSTPQRHKSRLVSWISYDGIISSCRTAHE